MPESSYLGKIDLNASICIQNACEKCDCLTFIATCHTLYLLVCHTLGPLDPVTCAEVAFFTVFTCPLCIIICIYTYITINQFKNLFLFLLSFSLSICLPVSLSLSLFPLPPYEGYDKFDTPISFCWTSPSPSINLLFLWCTLFLNTNRTLKYRIL